MCDASRARRVCQELRWQGKSTRLRLEWLRKASRARGLARAARPGNAQAAARLCEPSRVAAGGAMRPQGDMERLLAALERALYA